MIDLPFLIFFFSWDQLILDRSCLGDRPGPVWKTRAHTTSLSAFAFFLFLLLLCEKTHTFY
jgi:hypothetical protein